MANIFEDFTPDELDELQRRVGGLIVMLPFTSDLMGHKTPTNTIQGNYLCLSGGDSFIAKASKQFVIDLFTLRTKEICERWFGSDPGVAAIRRSMRVIAEVDATGPTGTGARCE